MRIKRKIFYISVVKYCNYWIEQTIKVTGYRLGDQGSVSGKGFVFVCLFFFSSPLTFMVLGIHVRKSNQSVSKTSMRRWSVVNSHADQCHFVCVLYARWLRAQEKGSSWQTAQILSREWIEFSSCISPHWRDGELYIKETCTVMAM